MAFIVHNETLDAPVSLLMHDNDVWRDVPRKGILRRDDATATEFPTSAAARKAIGRTLAYDSRRDRTRPHRFTILELVPAPAKGAA